MPFKKGYIPFNKNRHLSDEHRKAISRGNKGKVGSMRGKKHRPETLLKMSIAQKGKSTWIKGKKMSESHKKNISEAAKKNGFGKWMIGKKMPMEQRIRQSIQRSGPNSHFWKGGISKKNKTERQLFMNTFEYKIWRKSVFERDNYTCIWCGKRGVKLNADHIKPYYLYPELRLAIDNGRTLCEICHRKTDSYGKRILKLEIQ